MGADTFRAAARSLIVIGLSIALTGCISGGDNPGPDESGDPSVTAESTGAGVETELLQIAGESSELYCDSSERMVAAITGATPGERIKLSSPKPIQLSDKQVDAFADDDGSYRLMWRCSPTEAGQPWELRIQGEESGRWATVSFVGTTLDRDGVERLEIELFEDTFLCDGTSTELGQLSNAEAFEPIVFSAERTDELIDGEADAEGLLVLSWQCSPDEAGSWEVAARGVESDRVGQFTIVGRAPSPDEMITPQVQVEEDPFVCDGGSRVFAVLSAFLPGEIVNFTSPQTSDLTAGRADDVGSLPIQWTCGGADAAKVWELTAIGDQSGRRVSFTVNGAKRPAAPDPTISIAEDPFRCDGATRFLATISGFAPREYVDFTSPQSEDLRQGQADESGELQVRWTCEAAEIGQAWDVIATGATSLRSVSFKITGAAP